MTGSTPPPQYVCLASVAPAFLARLIFSGVALNNCKLYLLLQNTQSILKNQSFF